MRWITKLRSRYSKKATTTTTSTQPTPSTKDLPSWSLYRSISELPLSRWIDLTVDGYRKALVKTGEPPEHELLIAEHNLRMQYADAIGDHEYRLYCDTIKEITRLQVTLHQVESLINTMREAFHPLLGEQLGKLLNYKIKFDENDRKQIDHELLLAFRRSRTIKLRLDLKMIQYRKLEEKYAGTGITGATREYYMGMLISLSDDAGYPLTDTIPVWEFCERIKRANKKVEQINQLNAKKGK